VQLYDLVLQGAEYVATAGKVLQLAPGQQQRVFWTGLQFRPTGAFGRFLSDGSDSNYNPTGALPGEVFAAGNDPTDTAPGAGQGMLTIKQIGIGDSYVRTPGQPFKLRPNAVYNVEAHIVVAEGTLRRLVTDEKWTICTSGIPAVRCTLTGTSQIHQYEADNVSVSPNGDGVLAISALSYDADGNIVCQVSSDLSFAGTTTIINLKFSVVYGLPAFSGVDIEDPPLDSQVAVGSPNVMYI
jgi:hypothetical protein